MTIRPKVRKAALVGALAVVTASAWATISNSSYVPAPNVAAESSVATTGEAGVGVQAPTEYILSVTDAPPVLVVDRSVAQPAITIEQRRLSGDERIQATVMDRLASNPRLSGKIGVESHDAVVRLSGYTRTVGQAWHAERDARSVVGVRYVQNEIRPRVGGSV